MHTIGRNLFWTPAVCRLCQVVSKNVPRSLAECVFLTRSVMGTYWNARAIESQIAIALLSNWFIVCYTSYHSFQIASYFAHSLLNRSTCIWICSSSIPAHFSHDIDIHTLHRKPLHNFTQTRCTWLYRSCRERSPCGLCAKYIFKTNVVLVGACSVYLVE